MSDQCACGNKSGANSECERCRLIAEVARLRESIADYRAMRQTHAATIKAREQEIGKLRELLRECAEYLKRTGMSWTALSKRLREELGGE